LTIKDYQAPPGASDAADTGIADDVALRSETISNGQVQLVVVDLKEGLAWFDVDDQMVFCSRRCREFGVDYAQGYALGPPAPI